MKRNIFAELTEGFEALAAEREGKITSAEPVQVRPARKAGQRSMHPILRKLEGGDRRSIGRSNEVAAEVIANPTLFGTLFSGLLSEDQLLRMRAADAVEKVTARHPEYLRPYKTTLIGHVARLDQKEVRWHTAQMLPRIKWSKAERQQVLRVLTGYLNDRSSIVKTFAMQALADLVEQAPEIRPAVVLHLRELMVTGTPAMKARGRKLLAGLCMPTRRPTGRAAKRRPG